METMHTVCSECLREVDAAYVVEHEAVDIRGVSVEGEFKHLICPECGERIGQLDIAGRNLDKMYRAYREKLDIPQPEEIVALRKGYGFTQRVFAAILDIGVASLQRYEQGALASDSHAQLLRQARDPRFLRDRLRQGARKLSEEERAHALQAVTAQCSGRVDYAVIRFDVLDGMAHEESLETGMRAFDPDRLREVVADLAAHVRDLYRTKLNKILFYLDFASYRDTGRGFTGLRYAKADFGPVPDQYELMMGALVDGAALALREQGEGQVVVARRGADLSSFTPDEVARLDAVCAFANTFETASALSEFSHQEPGWCETPTGSLIPYAYAEGLQWDGADGGPIAQP